MPLRLPLLSAALLLAAPPPASGWITCDPLAHGAAGTGLVYDTAALRAAAAQCGAAGGGTLLLAAGRTFLTGHFNLSSNTELRVEGTLLGSPNATDYVLVEPLPWYGPDPQSTPGDAREWAPLIQSWHASNVSITGSGLLDGSGAAWWQCAGDIARAPCSGHVRPHGIRLVGGAGFSISGVSIRNMPMWQVHLAGVTGAHVHDVSITAPASAGHNTDGCVLGGAWQRGRGVGGGALSFTSPA
jgi:polygalacturonase